MCCITPQRSLGWVNMISEEYVSRRLKGVEGNGAVGSLKARWLIMFVLHEGSWIQS